MDSDSLDIKNIMKEYDEHLDFFKDLTAWGKEMQKKEDACKPKKPESEIVSLTTQYLRYEDSDKTTREKLNNKQVKKRKALTNANYHKFDADEEIKHNLISSSDTLQQVLEEQAGIEKQQEYNRTSLAIDNLKSVLDEYSNKSTSKMLNNNQVTKKKAMTYADWDKFDADKECEKVDHDSESSSDSLQQVLEEQAAIEKQQGNQYVKQGKWDEAIRCYTNAIKYYEYDPIFYANRGLCYMKKNEMKKTVRDCSIAINLDNTYVKAYLRRAAAREALNDLKGAESDLQRILILEPKNSEAKKRFHEVEKKAKGLLQSPTSTVQRVTEECSSYTSNSEEPMKSVAQLTSTKIDTHNPSFLWPSGEVDNIIKAIKKPPHMISKKPLTRIPIQEINTVLTELSESPEEDRKPKTKFTLIEEDLKVVQPKITETKKLDILMMENQELTQIEQKMMMADLNLVVPRTALQFWRDWKQLEGKDDVRANYLNMISPEKFPSIFKNSLTSEILSEILNVLADQFPQKGYNTFEYLLHLSNIKRFNAVVMFLSSDDMNTLRQIVDHCKKTELHSEDEINALILKLDLRLL